MSLAAARSGLMPALIRSRKQFKHVYVVGDSLEPRRIRNAIAEGFETGHYIRIVPRRVGFSV
jgi:hypothetical protein